jgi:hypothetical protein
VDTRRSISRNESTTESIIARDEQKLKLLLEIERILRTQVPVLIRVKIVINDMSSDVCWWSTTVFDAVAQIQR